MFDRLREVADERGISAVLDGFNADDTGDWRPGERAARERGVLSPLKEAGLGKEDIRELCRRYGLSVAEKPSFACLASRLPYGTEVTPERLAQVAGAESFLRGQGFRVFRVRHHGETARLELGEGELLAVADPAQAETIARGVAESGFAHVCFDVEGFRSGNMNRTADSDLLAITSPAAILREAGLAGAEYRTLDDLITITVPADSWATLLVGEGRRRLVEAFARSSFTHVAVELA